MFQIASIVSRMAFRSRISYKLWNKIQIQHLSELTGPTCKDTRTGLVVGIYQKETESDDPRLTCNAETYDNCTGGKLKEIIRDYRLTGELGKAKYFTAPDKEFETVCVVGLGPEGLGYSETEALHEGLENVRIAAGIGARKLRDHGCSTIFVDPMNHAEQAAEGSALATWRYQENKQKKDRKIVPKLELYESSEIDAWTRGLFKADAQNLARTLTDAPANQLTPTTFAQAAVDALCPCGVNVEIRNLDWIETQGLGSFSAVARSSCEPPALVEINYQGDEKGGTPVVLTGIGITFNSGGLCLTNCDTMSEQKAAMAGGAVVIAVIRAAAALALPINIIGIVPMCENMPSGMSFKPGDVITSLNGKTICIEDPNQIARIVIADILTYSQNNFKPKMIIDVTTVSKHIMKAVGQAATGVFTNSEHLWKLVHSASVVSGDRVWRLPLWNYFSREIKNCTSVDLSNKGDGQATSCIGAAFIKEFIPNLDWIHLDISGTGMIKDTCNIEYLENGRMSGRPTRTLIELLHNMACNPEKHKLN